MLTHGEYRESVDVDFLISDKAGFKDLRRMLTDEKGFAAIVRTGSQLSLASDIRADQYGIRTMLSAGGVEIKFEIIFGGESSLSLPAQKTKFVA